MYIEVSEDVYLIEMVDCMRYLISVAAARVYPAHSIEDGGPGSLQDAYRGPQL